MKKAFIFALAFTKLSLQDRGLQTQQISQACTNEKDCQKVSNVVLRKQSENQQMGYKEDLIEYLQQKFYEINTSLNQTYAKNQQFQTIYILGATGAGKSTLINYLLQSKMNYTFNQFQQKFVIEPQNNQGNLLPKIGHTSNSQTSIPKSFCVQEKGNYCFVDTPGFLNTKGTLQEILDSFSNSKIFSKGNKIKLLLTVQMDALKSGRGKFLIDAFKRLKQLFPNNFYQVLQSSAIIISKAKTANITDERIYEILKKMINDKKQFEPQISMYINQILNNQRVFIFPTPNHLNQQNMKLLLTKIQNIKTNILNSDATLNLTSEGKIIIQNYSKQVQKKLNQALKMIEIRLEKNFLIVKYENSQQLGNKLLQIKKAFLIFDEINKNKQIEGTFLEKLLFFIGLSENDKEILMKSIYNFQFCHQLHKNIQVQPIFNDMKNKMQNVIQQLQRRLLKMQNKENIQHIVNNHRKQTEKLMRQIQQMKSRQCQLI